MSSVFIILDELNQKNIQMQKNRFNPILILVAIIGLLIGIGGTILVGSWQVSSCQRDCEDAAMLGKYEDYCKNSADHGLCIEFKKNQCQLNCNFIN